MGRTVSAVVTFGSDCLGVAGPFAVDVPWWADVGPVVAGLTARLGVGVVVLRLLSVDGGEGARDGHVTYHVEAAAPPGRGLSATTIGHAELVAPQRFRAPWATSAGLRELLGWATAELVAAGRPVTGAVEQHRTWNLAGLFRLPTARGPVWLKATPHFAADEAAAIAMIGRASTRPRAGRGRGRRGTGCCSSTCPARTAGRRRNRLSPVRSAGSWPSRPRSPGSRPRTCPTAATSPGGVGALLDDGVTELTGDERAAARRLAGRWADLDACGLPDTLVHGDFHPGNWRGDAATGGPRLRRRAPGQSGARRPARGRLPARGHPPGRGAARGRRPGNARDPAATRPAPWPSRNRSPTSPTPCATRSSSTASSPPNGSTTPATRPRPSAPRCAWPANRARGRPHRASSFPWNGTGPAT